MFWLTDPKTNQKSVSLTLAAYATVFATITGLLQVCGKVQSTGPFVEMFYSTLALYFGRRFSVNGKIISAEQAEELKQKVDKA